MKRGKLLESKILNGYPTLIEVIGLYRDGPLGHASPLHPLVRKVFD